MDRSRRRTFAIPLCAAFLASACAPLPDVPPPSAMERSAHDLVNRATISLALFATSDDHPALRDALRGACAVLLFPGIGSAGFLVGGGHGHGVLLVRDDATGAWRGPAFYSLTEADVGLQAGIGERELVVVLHACTGLARLYAGRSTLRLGTFVAESAEREDGVAVTQDVRAFSRMHGLFVGASIDGSVLSPAPALATAFYGAPRTPAAILADAADRDDGGREIRRAIERAARPPATPALEATQAPARPGF